MARSIATLLLILVAAASARAADVSVQLDSGAGFVVKNATGAVERIRVDEATGNVSRNGALFVHTTGTNSLFVGVGVGSLASSGNGNTALGTSTLSANTTGAFNTAVGFRTLEVNTTGSYNTVVGFNALRANTTGISNVAAGYGALRFNTTGHRNSGFGSGVLHYNTTGKYNAASGHVALYYNTTGNNNSAFGYSALFKNTTGGSNAAVGYMALHFNRTGIRNTAVGSGALFDNNTGSYNVALGSRALVDNTIGTDNVAIGRNAGEYQTNGSNNIYVANTGVASESGQIKIGTVGTHTQATIAGIHGATSVDGVAVLVNASGTLGTTTSSARFKRDVEDMGDASDLLMRLRPVRFHYLESAVGVEASQVEQYGLIAEEVAEVAPELVAPDGAGKPYSVKYHVLPALLLNEIQKEHRANADQQRTIEAQRELIASLSSRLAALETRAAK